MTSAYNSLRSWSYLKSFKVKKQKCDLELTVTQRRTAHFRNLRMHGDMLKNGIQCSFGYFYHVFFWKW